MQYLCFFLLGFIYQKLCFVFMFFKFYVVLWKFRGALMDDAVILPCGHSFGDGGLQHAVRMVSYLETRFSILRFSCLLLENGVSSYFCT